MCTPAVRVLLVDDSVAFAEALGEALSLETCLDIVGIVEGVASGLQFLRHHPVDLVISDVNMPHGGLASLMVGIAAIGDSARPKVIAMSGDTSGSTSLAHSLNVAFIDKQSSRAQFMACIDAILCAE
jgi:DNA-binding NarL/FixJ family response regulator